jgi:SsrA-binding protein
MKILSKNNSSYFKYFVVDKFEAGIVLLGSEVKSIINGGISLKESYVRIENNELWL